MLGAGPAYANTARPSFAGTPRGFDSATDYTTLLFLIAGAQTQVMDFALSSLLLAPSLAGWHSRIGFSTLVAQLQTNTMYRHIHDEN
ncbi:hypothetical protein PF011_g30945 [Phytophthora fragariae]|uniref:Uncharacterized protein n=1 Tax=Phytophthora fragariae TaxID=53985 RepID=A0A6A3GRT0_9STRA|nr:hypothetical protein PF011_g30945 [Phytophthora fragariae]